MSAFVRRPDIAAEFDDRLLRVDSGLSASEVLA